MYVHQCQYLVPGITSHVEQCHHIRDRPPFSFASQPRRGFCNSFCTLDVIPSLLSLCLPYPFVVRHFQFLPPVEPRPPLSMSYAPYQDESNEPDAPLEADPTARQGVQGQHTSYSDDVENGGDIARGGFGNGLGADERNPDPFTTSLPVRLEAEASLAYLALPPAGPAILLMMEHKNDYVRYVSTNFEITAMGSNLRANRFHAWQSALLFTCLFVFHLIFSFSPHVSFILLAVDLVMIAFLTLHAYKDGICALCLQTRNGC